MTQTKLGELEAFLARSGFFLDNWRKAAKRAQKRRRTDVPTTDEGAINDTDEAW